MKIPIFLVFVVVFLTGCQEKAKTQEYYSQHLDEAKARVEICKKLVDYNEIQQQDCANANNAIFYNSSRNDFKKSNPNALEW